MPVTGGGERLGEGHALIPSWPWTVWISWAVLQHVVLLKAKGAP